MRMDHEIGQAVDAGLSDDRAARIRADVAIVEELAHYGFEGLCEEGEDPEETGSITIPIATFASPAITKERVPYCNDCPDGVPSHSLAIHLPDQEWVDRTIREYGPDHPYVIAKVHAKFPKGGGGLTIPVTWVEAAQQSDDPTGPGWRRLCDLGLEEETATHTVKDGAWVRLGVDVAADGGDEFVISRIVGDVIETRYSSSGTMNDDQVLLAEKVLEEILIAQRLAAALGSAHPVRVKVDQNGIGHGVVSMLKRWADTGRHQAQIVGVMVSESPTQDDPGAVMRPYRKRDEMWLATRGLLQADPVGSASASTGRPASSPPPPPPPPPPARLQRRRLLRRRVEEGYEAARHEVPRPGRRRPAHRVRARAHQPAAPPWPAELTLVLRTEAIYCPARGPLYDGQPCPFDAI
ncbi:hypothetical protein ACFV5J_38645 [Streptomyces zaomyceticus]|uniref:hypothetical protein n=1 Tax=Streptomyces zaomyceticus TaxID=68286 RepID=UPI0036670196